MELFKPYVLGDYTLKNRIVMAPMTRCRAIDNIPNELMEEYYAQRAGAGLIISEGTSPSVNGIGYARIPGAYSPAQIVGWRQIANKVHENDGLLFVQLMHCGRIAAAENLPNGGEVVAPSAAQASGEMYTDENGMQPHVTPRAMTRGDLDLARDEFVNAARLLINANVDGVELHAANGYLLDQFLNPNSNLREDEYGGNFENRARFVLETAEKVVDAVGGGKVGIRISPYGAMNDVSHNYDDLVEMYAYLALKLKDLGIAYIHIVDHTGSMGAPEFKSDIKATIKGAFVGTVITGGDIDSKEKGEQVIDDGFDLAYIGRPFISNPDLVEKLKKGQDLTAPNPDLFYTPGPKGYIDY